MPPEIQQGQLPQDSSNTYIATDGSRLNPTAVLLAKSIRKIESNHDYNAVGDNGESHGAYQFNKNNFSSWAQQYGLDPNDMSPVNQDRVAYTRINDLLGKGLRPSEVAAMWNGAKATSTGYKAINPQYVEKVKSAYTDYYNEHEQQNQFVTPPKVSQTPIEQPTPETPKETSGTGFFSNLLSGNFGEAAKQAVDFAFPIVPDIQDIIQGKSTKSPLQVLGDVGLSALWFVPGLGLAGKGAQLAAKSSGLLGKIAGSKLAMGALEGGALGYGADVASKLAKGETDVGNIITPGIGTVAGGALGGIGAKVGQYLDSLPNRITRGALKLDEGTSKYALETKKIGSVKGLLEQSQKSADELGSQVNSILTSPKYMGAVGEGAQTIQKTLDRFPNSNLTTEGITDAVKTVAPLYSKLVDKVADGTATLLEKNTLRQGLDHALYLESGKLSKLSTADKTIAYSFSNDLRNEVQTMAAETAPIFAQYSKEMTLMKALKRLAKRAPGNLITFRDLLGAGIGGGIAGIPGAAGALALEKLSTTPTGQFGIAKGIRALSPVAKKAGVLSKITAVKGISGQTNR